MYKQYRANVNYKGWRGSEKQAEQALVTRIY